MKWNCLFGCLSCDDVLWRLALTLSWACAVSTDVVSCLDSDQ